MTMTGPNPPEEIYVHTEAIPGSRLLYSITKELPAPLLKEIKTREYPAAYGYIPETHHTDGRPLDAFVLISEQPALFALVIARPIGMLRLEGEKLPDDKIVAVALGDSEWSDVKDINELPKHILKEIEQVAAGVETKKIEWLPADRAKKAIERAIELYKKELG